MTSLSHFQYHPIATTSRLPLIKKLNVPYFASAQPADDINLNQLTEEKLLKEFEWTQDVKPPEVTISDISQSMSDILSATTNKTDGLTMALKLVGKSLNSIKLTKKYQHELNVKSKQYLPDEIKEDIKKYKRFKYWVHRILKGKVFAETRLIEMQGPPAIKNLQTHVTDSRPAILSYIEELDRLKSQTKEDRDTGNKWVNLVHHWILRPMQIRHYKKQIKQHKIEQQLVYNASQVSLDKFKPEVKELKAQYAKQGDKMTPISSPYRSASMAQTFVGQCESGKEVILKFVRPRLTPEFMTKYRKYLYFTNMVKMGTDLNSRYMAAVNANLHVEYLQREADLHNEYDSLIETRAEKEALGLDGFNIPEPHYVTKNGRGLAMEKTGNVSFEELTAEQIGELLVNAAPDMAAFQLLSKKKHSDLTGGNLTGKGTITQHDDTAIVTLTPNQKPNMIDLGRTIDMIENRQEQLLDVMMAYLSISRTKADGTSKPTQDYFLNNTFLEALTTLLKGTNTDAESNLIKLLNLSKKPLKKYIKLQHQQLEIDLQIKTVLKDENIDNPTQLTGDPRKKWEHLTSEKKDLKETCDTMAEKNLKNEVSTYLECIEHLDPVLAQLLNHNASNFPKNYLGFLNQNDPILQLGNTASPSVFDVLYNVMAYNQMQQNHNQHHLGDFSEVTLPFHEISNIRKKFYGSLSQYFITPTNKADFKSKCDLLRQNIESEDNENILKRFPYLRQTQLLGNADVIQYLFSLKKGDTKTIEENIEQILSDKKYIEQLVYLETLNTRLTAMTNRVTEVWIKKQKKKLDQETLDTFKENFAQTLISDFGPKIKQSLEASQKTKS